MNYQVKEIDCYRDGLKIFGLAYIPSTDHKVPLVIYSHELGRDHTSGEGYAKYFAQRGIAYYIFDFVGGSAFENRSDGTSLDMSVLTELKDLEAVITMAKSWDFVSELILHGGSQGAVVTAMAAAERDDIKGEILMYGAYLIPESLHRQFTDLSNVPDKIWYMDLMNVSKKYVTDMWDVDVDERMKRYREPVLLLHGDDDKLIPVKSTEERTALFNNAEFHVVHHGHHGFKYDALDEADHYIENWLKNTVGVNVYE